MQSRAIELVDSQAQLDNITFEDERVAFDTEFLRRSTYHDIPCLLQLALHDRIVLIDAIANLELSTLLSYLSDASVQKICHNSEAELRICKDAYNINLSNVFDTNLAHAFLSTQLHSSLASLLEGYLGIQVDKTEQDSSWADRPLTKKQIEYAARDVAYLRELQEVLDESLAESGKAQWFQQESNQSDIRREIENEYRWTYMLHKAIRPYSDRIKRFSVISHWRDRTARELNLPIRWVMKERVLVELAKRKSINRRTIKTVPMHTDVGSHVETLVDDLRSVDYSDEIKFEFLKYPASDVVSLGKELKAIAQEVAEANQIAVDVLFRRKQVHELLDAFLQLGQLPDWFGEWRIELVGEEFRVCLKNFVLRRG